MSLPDYSINRIFNRALSPADFVSLVRTDNIAPQKKPIKKCIKVNGGRHRKRRS